MKTNSIVKARVEESTKNRAAEILEASGLTTSSAIRMFLLRIVEDEALPFDPRTPNPVTLKAIRDAKAGKVKKAKNSQNLIKKLNAKA